MRGKITDRFLLFSGVIGFVAFFSSFYWFFVNALNLEAYVAETVKSGVMPHAWPFFFPEKIFVLLWYLFSLALTGVWSSLCFFAFRRKQDEPLFSGCRIGLPAVWVILNVVSVLFSATGMHAAAIASGSAVTGWAFLLFQKAFGIKKNGKWGVVSAVSVLAVQTAVIAGPLFFTAPLIPGAYYSIPSQVKGRGGDAHDSISYVNEHNLAGITVYHPDIDNGCNPIRQTSPSLRFSGRPSEKFLAAVKKADALSVASSLGGGNFLRQNRIYPRIFYDEKNHSLVVAGGLPSELPKAAADELARGIPPESADDLAAFLNSSRHCGANGSNAATDAGLFKIRTHYENILKSQDRHIFHHHNFLLGAANEIRLGRPLDDINFQYGLAVTWVTSKVLALAGFDYIHYFRFLFSSYFLYLLIGCIAVRAVTGRTGWAIVFAVCCQILFCFCGYSIFIVAPGNAPLRHFSDIAAIALLAGFIRHPDRPCRQWLFILAAAAGIALDWTYGLLILSGCLIAIAAAVLSGRLCLPPRKTVFAAFAIWFCIAWISAGTGHNHLFGYYLRGLVAFPASPVLVTAFLTVSLVMLAAILVFFRYLRLSGAIAALAGTLSGMGGFLYYMWSSNIQHFLLMLPLTVFSAAVLADALRRNDEKKRFMLGNILALCAAGALAALPFYLLSMYQGRWNFFRTHAVHSGADQFRGLLFTFDENMLVEAADFIRVRSSGNGIFIFSRYDHILPLLAGKYSAMPYPDLQHCLVSEKECSAVIKSVEDTAPDYIFTDRDIMRNFEYDTALSSQVAKEALLRSLRLSCIQRCFMRISDDYEPVESCRLLTLWHRKTSRIENRGGI